MHVWTGIFSRLCSARLTWQLRQKLAGSQLAGSSKSMGWLLPRWRAEQKQVVQEKGRTYTDGKC